MLVLLLSSIYIIKIAQFDFLSVSRATIMQSVIHRATIARSSSR